MYLHDLERVKNAIKVCRGVSDIDYANPAELGKYLADVMICGIELESVAEGIEEAIEDKDRRAEKLEKKIGEWNDTE